jgi:hypothetical protein
MAILCVAQAFALGTGGGAVPFLSSGVGARAIALSGAFTAFYDDATVSYWNPGAAALVGRPAISSMYSWLTEDRSYNFLNILYPTQAGTIGFNLINFSITGIEGRVTDTEAFTDIKDMENAYILTYSYEIVKGFSAGINLKAIQVSLADSNAFGMSGDAGALLKINDILSAGLVFRDLAGSMKWSTGHVDEIPFAMRIGFLGQFFERAIKTSVEAEQNEFEGITLKSGAEAAFFRVFFLRAGCTYGLTSLSFDYTAGAGVRWPFGTTLVQADYAFVKEQYFSSFAAQHKVSLGIYF